METLFGVLEWKMLRNEASIIIQKHIAVVDGEWVGHHSIYVKTFVRVLLEAGYKVSVLCPAPEEMANWYAQTFSLEEGRFNAYYFSDSFLQPPEFLHGRFQSLLICLNQWFHIANALKKIQSSAGKPDMIFFAWLDSYLDGLAPAWLIDWQFPFAWSGLYFHPRHHRIKRKHPLLAKYVPPPESLVARSRLACSLAILDAGVVHKLRLRLFAKQVFVFPDFSDETPPCDNYHLVEEIKEKAQNRKIVGLLGSLERRKGLLTLLKVAEQPMARDWCFVVAGKLAEQTFSKQELNEIKLFFEEPRENFFVFFGTIPDDAQFNGLVNICDVIFAMYENFPHSSNLVTKAAAYGKKLLVSTGGYMEEVVNQYELGDAVSAEDVPAVLFALSRLTADGFANECSAGKRAYSMAQSQDKLRHAFLDLVEGCMGDSTHV
jgi:glycosyltransferase involved in cell wall biosynthesis